jgi:Transglutaminase-like superfamily/Glycosyl hydrolases family 18/Pseudomurein-binding repeat
MVKHGGIIINRRLLFGVIILFGVALLYINTSYAVTENQQITENITNSTPLVENSTNNVTSMNAAGDTNSNKLTFKGFYVKAEDVLANKVNINELKNAGVTDIFVKSNRLTPPTYQKVLNTIVGDVKGTGIKVHAWITCFKDVNGKWIDPQATDSYSTEQRKEVVNNIVNIAKNYNVDGIHLDYIRYSGAKKGLAHNNPRSTEAITSFVKNIYQTVKSIKPSLEVSAAVMPEGSKNTYYYGQDYQSLARYLDFMVPMLYEGNYQKNNEWIGKITNYIDRQIGKTKLYPAILTYRSDKDPTILPASELNQDIKSTMDNGADGYVLFRYGFIDPNFLNNSFTGSQVSYAAGATSFTLSQIQQASANIKKYAESNHKLPQYVSIGSSKVYMAWFLQILVSTVTELNRGVRNSVPLSTIQRPSSPSGDIFNANIPKVEYTDIAQRTIKYINSKKAAPNYAQSSSGKIQFDSLVYMFSKVVNYYSSNKRLPNNVYIDSSNLGTITTSSTTSTSTSTTPSIPTGPNLQTYLQTVSIDPNSCLGDTKNCEVSDPSIKATLQTLTSRATSQYAKAEEIFNWVRDNIDYTFYYGTKYGALATLQNKNGNCCDTSHLLIALSRAAGIPARYMHGYCTFSSGSVIGHVWPELYVGGKWYDADAISLSNTFGVINNWNKDSSVMVGCYSELPF